MVRTLFVCLSVLLVSAAPAGAFRLGRELTPLSQNPADALSSPIDPEAYDPATHCDRRPKAGVARFTAWVALHSRGVSWGTYRCERWGKHEASLHAEGRALDWHLDVDDPAGRRDARKLIELLLAPDRDGNQHALARRMGVEELIWDCSYWGAGSDEFRPYEPCYGKDGDLRKHVDPTIAHRNHVHIGFSRAGAAAKTSFWIT
jgi:hypothetical protein